LQTEARETVPFKGKMIDLSVPKAAPTTRSKRHAEGNSAPGPNTFGVLKSASLFLQDPVQVLLRDGERYGDIVRYQIGNSTVVHLLSHPDHIEHVLLTNNRNYRKFSPHAMLTQEIGNGLLLNEGESWFSQRRLLQPAFQPRHFAGLSASSMDATFAMLDRWSHEYSEGRQIDFEDEMARLIRFTIGHTLFSANVQDEILAVLTSCGGKLSLLLGNLPVRLKNRRFRDAVAQLDAVIYGVIDERRAMIEREQELPSDILSMLLQVRDKDTGEAMSDRQLRDELVTLLIAGYDTTSRTLTWAFYSLSRTPRSKPACTPNCTMCWATVRPLTTT
jgi:cytochrome P450